MWRKFDRGSAIKYVRSEGRRIVQLNAYWLALGGGEFQMYEYLRYEFFSQIRYKIKIKEKAIHAAKIIHSHLPRTAKSSTSTPGLLVF